MFIEAWSEHLDSLAPRQARRLAALGMCRLLGAPSAAVLPQLGALVAGITGAVFEQQGGGGGGDEVRCWACCGSVREHAGLWMGRGRPPVLRFRDAGITIVMNRPFFSFWP